MNVDVLSKLRVPMHGKRFQSALILSGWAVALTLSLAPASAATDDAASAPQSAARKTERVFSDSWITTKVKSEILKSSLTTGFDVKVITRHGAVTLKGSLGSADVIDQVKAIAAKVKGVKSVDTTTLVVAANPFPRPA